MNLHPEEYSKNNWAHAYNANMTEIYREYPKHGGYGPYTSVVRWRYRSVDNGDRELNFRLHYVVEYGIRNTNKKFRKMSLDVFDYSTSLSESDIVRYAQGKYKELEELLLATEKSDDTKETT